jgi:hypothetical protein
MSSADQPTLEAAPATLPRVDAGVLAYGEVRLGGGEIAIGFESLPEVGIAWRVLVAQAVAAARVRLDNVLVVRISEARVEVDVLDEHDLAWPVRTVRVSAGRMRPGSTGWLPA